jgi:hypothetical protein
MIGAIVGAITGTVICDTGTIIGGLVVGIGVDENNFEKNVPILYIIIKNL